eukprot:TRINITY_DN17819_c0_g1_i2.p2 TRINITY_DN17819_c0_g1~~TRINITY_DN17819_c0_g1_i2.p2  ORF type:complete len:119 (-),score=34.49 TRINITY_DN17819_c0_g1_i2:89-445(-)
MQFIFQASADNRQAFAGLLKNPTPVTFNATVYDWDPLQKVFFPAFAMTVATSTVEFRGQYYHSQLPSAVPFVADTPDTTVVANPQTYQVRLSLTVPSPSSTITIALSAGKPITKVWSK